MLKLNLGNTIDLPEYQSVPRDDCYPLNFDDESVDEIYASHVLQYFPHAIIEDVLVDWVRTLKQEGEIWLAVPNINQINMDNPNWVTEIFGTQTSETEYHKCIFNETLLLNLMGKAKLTKVCPWSSGNRDKSRLGSSLNIMAVKPAISSESAPSCRLPDMATL